MREYSWIIVTVVGFSGCGGEEAPPAETLDPETSAPETAAPAPAKAVDPSEEACAAQILVTYAGAEKAPDTVRRSKDEARTRAGELLAKVHGGAPFEVVVRTDTDHEASRANGGVIGTRPRATWPPEMAEAIFSLDVGSMSPAPVETPRGYHIFKRLPVEKVRARHILVRYRGSKNDRGATRSKADAERMARRIRADVTKAGADFAAIARERSEDGSASRGGDLGEFGRGQMVPSFDAAVFQLEANAVSEVVESDFGFHVIQRL